VKVIATVTIPDVYFSGLVLTCQLLGKNLPVKSQSNVLVVVASGIAPWMFY